MLKFQQPVGKLAEKWAGVKDYPLVLTADIYYLAAVDVTELTDRAEIRTRLKGLREEAAAENWQFSDVVDDDGHQYVDLVLGGGGVLGIALAGYTYVLEQMGIRFLRIGGTSAGAINAMLLAALGTREEAKTPHILKHLVKLDLPLFLDGGVHAHHFIRTFRVRTGKFRVFVRAFRVFDRVRDHLGLNPGLAFEQWLREVLDSEGVSTTATLLERVSSVPKGLRRRDGTALTEQQKAFELALVAADVTTETKVVFPAMAGLYWQDPDSVHPAAYVRASMSVPFFFEPFRVADIPQGPEAWTRWEALVNYSSDLPRHCLFVDGGVMSNFPVDIFHRSVAVPSAPTFGVKLGTNQRNAHVVRTPTALAGAVFDCARHCLDFDFVTRNPDYKHVVECIDTGSHDWLDFNLSDDAKYDLFRRGTEAAERFLRRFRWTRYKQLRADLARAYHVDAHWNAQSAGS